ncbi:ankyrin repeat domain-containing protein [Kitasatospora sp. NPDC004240]
MPEPTSDTTEPALDPEVLQLAPKVFDLARHGDTDTLASYIDAGVPVNLTNEGGDSLVMLAAYHGHGDTVKALLDRDADPNRANSKGQTPLVGAVFKCDEEVVRILLAHGADPSAGTPSAVEAARAYGQQDLLKLLQGGS